MIVEGLPIPYTTIFDVDSGQEPITWFVNAFVVQFAVQKKQNFKSVVVEQLVVTVHETQPIPKYQPLYGAYPAEVDLFYVEIDANNRTIPREFTPTRFYRQKTDESDETQDFPRPIVIDDDVPAPIAIRFNSAKSGMYLMSVDIVVSSGEMRETLPVMPPQWAIFEHFNFDDDLLTVSDSTDVNEPPHILTDNESNVDELRESETQEKYTLYKVGDNSIDPLGIVCTDWRELRKIYHDRARAANEVLLEVHNGDVRRIETFGSIVSNGQVRKWNPCDESQKCGKRVLLIKRASIDAEFSMPPSQLSIWTSVPFRQAVAKLVDTDKSGNPLHRFWPENIDCKLADKYWQVGVEFPRESLPCILIMNSFSWHSFPLPLTVDEAMQLVEDHLR